MESEAVVRIDFKPGDTDSVQKSIADFQAKISSVTDSWSVRNRALFSSSLQQVESAKGGLRAADSYSSPTLALSESVLGKDNIVTKGLGFIDNAFATGKGSIERWQERIASAGESFSKFKDRAKEVGDALSKHFAFDQSTSFQGTRFQKFGQTVAGTIGNVGTIVGSLTEKALTFGKALNYVGLGPLAIVGAGLAVASMAAQNYIEDMERARKLLGVGVLGGNRGHGISEEHLGFLQGDPGLSRQLVNLSYMAKQSGPGKAAAVEARDRFLDEQIAALEERRKKQQEGNPEAQALAKKEFAEKASSFSLPGQGMLGAFGGNPMGSMIENFAALGLKGVHWGFGSPEQMARQAAGYGGSQGIFQTELGLKALKAIRGDDDEEEEEKKKKKFRSQIYQTSGQAYQGIMMQLQGDDEVAKAIKQTEVNTRPNAENPNRPNRPETPRP